MRAQRRMQTWTRTTHGSRQYTTVIAKFRNDVFAHWCARYVANYGSAKNERTNIDKDEEQPLKKLAVHLLSLADSAIEQAEHAGELKKVDWHAKN